MVFCKRPRRRSKERTRVFSAAVFQESTYMYALEGTPSCKENHLVAMFRA